MITLYCHPGYKGTWNMVEAILCGHHPRCRKPLDVLPLLVEEDRLHTPACEAVLRQLSGGWLNLDADPCYLVYREGQRRPLFCFNRSWQAALAVAAVADLPPDSGLLARLRQRVPFGPPIPAGGRTLCLELTPELCDAQVWRALNSLDRPVELAAGVQRVEQLRSVLEETPPKAGREAPYCLVREGGCRPLKILACQDAPGRDGDTLLTDGDGFDLLGFHWQDPASWYRWEMDALREELPCPRTDPVLPGLQTGYAVRDRMRWQNSLDYLRHSRTLCLMVLEREPGGHWRAGEQILEECGGYRELFDEALRGAGPAPRWVLAAALDRAPLCLQELAVCEALFGFRLYRDTVTLTDGPEALRMFLKALERYGQTPPGKRAAL